MRCANPRGASDPRRTPASQGGGGTWLIAARTATVSATAMATLTTASSIVTRMWNPARTALGERMKARMQNWRPSNEPHQHRRRPQGSDPQPLRALPLFAYPRMAAETNADDVHYAQPEHRGRGERRSDYPPLYVVCHAP